MSTELLDDAEIAVTSHTLQSLIDKACDVRVTVACPHVFGVAIHSISAAGRIDWRSGYNSLRYTQILVPDAVAENIGRYLRRLGLLYGAFDFSIDHGGRWWFLECNPNGQWGFIAQATGMPIAGAIADLLTGEAVL